MVCVTSQKFTVTSDVGGDNWLNYFVTVCRYKYTDKAVGYTHAQTLTRTRTIVGG